MKCPGSQQRLWKTLAPRFSMAWRRTSFGMIAFAMLLCPVLAFTSRGAEVSTPSHQGVTLYVSKLGDNSNGSSWQHAFQTIQAALNAIPTEQGGHRVIVRPDTYAEANLYPAHKGATNAYNVLEGDWDGRW